MTDIHVDVDRDEERRTLSLTTRFDADPARVWQVWADPRQLERWWGPPTYPATVVDHDLRPGGAVSYYMTGPEGDRYHGWWSVRSVDAPHHLEFEDGFADDTGRPDPDRPVTTVHVSIEADGDGTRMRVTSTFGSLEAMRELDAMGMVDGMTAAMGQIPEVLATSAVA
ncbi:MAG: SRPBCC domain-containing protein [Actinomycetes bacterium]